MVIGWLKEADGPETLIRSLVLFQQVLWFSIG